MNLFQHVESLIAFNTLACPKHHFSKRERGVGVDPFNQFNPPLFNEMPVFICQGYRFFLLFLPFFDSILELVQQCDILLILCGIFFFTFYYAQDKTHRSIQHHRVIYNRFLLSFAVGLPMLCQNQPFCTTHNYGMLVYNFLMTGLNLLQLT